METGVTPEPRDWEATAERLVFLPDSGGSHRRLSTTVCSSVHQGTAKHFWERNGRGGDSSAHAYHHSRRGGCKNLHFCRRLAFAGRVMCRSNRVKLACSDSEALILRDSWSVRLSWTRELSCRSPGCYRSRSECHCRALRW